MKDEATDRDRSRCAEHDGAREDTIDGDGERCENKRHVPRSDAFVSEHRHIDDLLFMSVSYYLLSL